ncbi:MAG: ubiquinol-cytochrome c reductase iron-sulfur subunit [Chloroflexi bacterium]|nr:ubiquinol-cytochrome c reductase iron-sulfur subunit [Chloroflexota bacterium]
MADYGPQNREGVDRRTFLAYAAGATVAFMGTVLGALALGAGLTPAFKPKSEGDRVKLGNMDDFSLGVPKKVDFVLYVKDGWVETPSPKSVWVVRQEGGEFTVFNSRCTHLGCIVDWKKGNRGPAFYSPCHAGVFTIEGTVIGGPPPRSLDALEYDIEAGELYCEYRDFVLGVPGKEPA